MVLHQMVYAFAFRCRTQEVVVGSRGSLFDGFFFFGVCLLFANSCFFLS